MPIVGGGMPTSDPDSERKATYRLAEFLRAEREHILSAWEEAARRLPPAQELDSKTLRNHLPHILRQIEETARQAHGSETPLPVGEYPEIHAMERLDEGYDLEEVVEEYALLRETALRMWIDRGLGTAGGLLLNRALDEAIRAAVARYHEARARTLVALDRISAAALESTDLEGLLKALSRVLLETTEAVDSIILYLREGDTLVARVVTGLDETAQEGLTLRMGEGFAGKVAADRRPLALRDAAHSELVDDPVLQKCGIHALYGVPMVLNEEVIGVAHVGSRTAFEFSDDDKLLFRAMVERATSAIAQARLRSELEARQAALRESEERFRLLVESVPDYAIYMLSADGRVASWNMGAERLKGYTGDEILGEPYSRFFPPEAIAAGVPTRILQQAAAEGRVHEEGQRLRKDGTRFWADIVVTALRDPDGNLRGFSKLTRDITARKALEAEHDRALDAIEHGDAFFLLDSEFRFQLVNQAQERLTRTRREDTLGRRFWDVFPAAADPEGKFWQEYHRVLRDRVSVRFEAYYAPLNLWTDVSAYPSRDGGIAVFFRDITARRRVEAIRNFFLEAGTLLSESLDVATPLQHLARLVVRYLADYCIVDLVDEEGQLRRVQAVARDDAKQELMRQTLPYSPRNGSGSPVQQAFERGEITVVPEIGPEWLDASARDETHRAVLDALGPRSAVLVPLEARGRKLGIINIVWAQPGRALPEDVEVARAVAERASVAIDNVRLYQHAQEAIRARDQLWGVARHELRTPLSSLGLQLQLAERLAQQQPGGEDAISRVLPKIQAARRQVERLSNLISELLDTTRAQAGRLELKCEEVDLPALVRELAERHRQEAAHAGSTLHVSAPARLTGYWDRSRLEQVVVNLLTNAIKYGEGKSIHVSVKQLDTAAACLEVRDEGMGIEPESLERIFQPFERTREARKRGGLGLGLFIVRQLVEAHGGTIQVDSRPGRGSTFTVELPLVPGAC